MRTFLPVFFLLILSSFCLPLSAQQNYAEVLQKSIFFYEAQQSGTLSPNNRVTWRGNAAMKDGSDVGLDLTGGWFDAGDNAKFNFPMAYSVTTLCWGYLENKQAYANAEQTTAFLEGIKHVTDYLIRCHTAPNELYGQVCDGGVDHSYWVPGEVIEICCKRPSYKIDAAHPGSDLAGETAAALAAASMCFQDTNPSYSATLLKHAKELYTFADTYRGKYTDVIPAGAFYNSWSGYNDELCWGAIWLFKATNDQSYLDRATDAYAYLGTIERSTDKDYSWTLAWDNKQYGCYVLMAALTGEAKYSADAERHLDEWFPNKSGKPGPTCTPSGFPVLDNWGTNRYVANTAFLLLEQSDNMTAGPKKDSYYARAKELIDYCLGDNPQKVSYVIGYGENYPKYPHHRSAHGSWCRSETIPAETRHILYGGLVGGHQKPNDFDWVDDRHDYAWNEVATDYNSLFQGAVARLYADFGGSIDPTFPIEEVPNGEFAVEAKLNSSGSTHSEYAVWVYNKTAWPARVPSTFAFRLYFNLSEGFDAGYSVSDYIVSSNGNSATYTGLLPADEANGIYYTEVTFNSDEIIYPGGQGESKREAQIRVRLPYEANASAWDPTNDWSMTGVTRGLKEVPNIPLYADGELVYGNVPVEPVVIPVEGVTISSANEELEIGTQVQLTASVLPADASNKSVTFSSTNSAIATVTSSGKVSAVAEGEAEIIATSVDGNFTAICVVTVIPEVVIPVTGIEISSSTLDINIGQSASLSAQVSPANASDKAIVWSSDNSAVATVTQQGVVVGVSEGSVVITATTVDGGFVSSCSVTVTKIVLPEYTISTSVDGNGSVSIDPVQATYTQGTTITLVATADSGYRFKSWSGNSSSSDATISVVVNADMEFIASFVEQGSNAGTPISIPFKQDGAGTFTWSTADEISFINSWCLDYLTINGVDYSNIWSNSMPAKQDGMYYIEYKASFPWAHFEANGTKSLTIPAGIASATSTQNSLSVYPNPATDFVQVKLPSESAQLEIYNVVGTMVHQQTMSNEEQLTIGVSQLPSGVYILKVINASGQIESKRLLIK